MAFFTVLIFSASSSGISMSKAIINFKLEAIERIVHPNRFLLLGYFGIFLNVADGVLHSLDLLGFFVRNFEIESFLEGHDKFYAVKRIGAEIVDERCTGCNLALFHAELVHNDLLNFILYPRHANSSCVRNVHITNSSVYMALGKARKTRAISRMRRNGGTQEM